MSFSVSSGMYSESSSASEEYSVSASSRSASSRSASLISSQAPSKWWHAEQLSEAFCEGVEQRFSCRNEEWKDVVQDETLDDDESTLENPPVIDTEKINNNIKSYSFLAKYHSSKTIDEKDGSEENKEKEKDVLNQLIQGNHRGWGAVRSTSTQNRSANNTNEILKETLLLSDEDTFDALTDGETCDDTYDDTLEHTCDSTYDGTFDSTCPDDEAYSDDDDRSLRKYFKSSRKNIASDSRSSVTSSSSKDPSDVSRNDSMQYSLRNNINNSDLERDSPSFGSNNTRQKLKEKHSRSFGSQPSISSIDGSHSSNSNGATFARPSYVTPKKILANYQSPSKASPTNASGTMAQTLSSERASIKSGGKNKMIALGKSRATARLIKEQAAKSKPKAFPYIINHSLFHQNLDKRKTRTLSHRRTGE
jgi:hypothetical protein